MVVLARHAGGLGVDAQAARAPGTLIAAIEAPVPDQQQTDPALGRALGHAARHGRAGLDPLFRAAGGRAVELHLVPRLTQGATTSSVSGVTSSDPTAMTTDSP